MQSGKIVMRTKELIFKTKEGKTLIVIVLG